MISLQCVRICLHAPSVDAEPMTSKAIRVIPSEIKRRALEQARHRHELGILPNAVLKTDRAGHIWLLLPKDGDLRTVIDFENISETTCANTGSEKSDVGTRQDRPDRGHAVRKVHIPDAPAAPSPGSGAGRSLKKAVEVGGTKNPDAVALGRRGGLKGGNARAAALSPERRREIARLAAKKRWNK